MTPEKLNLNLFDPYFEEINRELVSFFDSRVSLVEEIGRHILLAEGKRLRPLLFVLSAQICGYEGKDLYRLSIIFEYIHTASLLHDDVLDNAAIRRNRPSTNQVWGNQAAVLAGDFFFSRAMSLAVQTNSVPFLARLTETTAEMTEGQILELAHTHDWSTSQGTYLEIIGAKTASLISAACACGAIVAGSTPEWIEALSGFGNQAGMAFQLVDDLLDYTASEQTFGKPVGKDLQEGKITLPLIYTLQGMESAERDRLIGRFTNSDREGLDYQEVVSLVRQSGSFDRVRREARTYADQAAACLEPLPDSPIKSCLQQVDQFIIDREY